MIVQATNLNVQTAYNNSWSMIFFIRFIFVFIFSFAFFYFLCLFSCISATGVAAIHKTTKKQKKKKETMHVEQTKHYECVNLHSVCWSRDLVEIENSVHGLWFMHPFLDVWLNIDRLDTSIDFLKNGKKITSIDFVARNEMRHPNKDWKFLFFCLFAVCQMCTAQTKNN